MGHGKNTDHMALNLEVHGMRKYFERHLTYGIRARCASGATGLQRSNNEHGGNVN